MDRVQSNENILYKLLISATTLLLVLVFISTDPRDEIMVNDLLP